MDTIELTATGVWIHTSSGTGDSAARWSQGAARKGNYDGKRNLSLILFDADAIAQALDGVNLLGADLVLARDSAFGTAAVMVCVAPAKVASMTERYMAHSQCLNLADRRLHRCVMTEGAASALSLPGGMLRALKRGEANAFLLYQEEDGTDAFARFSAGAVLRLYTGTGWVTPVWTRTVAAGDVIGNHIRSHVNDLREIEYYINLRRAYDSLPEMEDIGANHDPAAFADWAAVVTLLQSGAQGFMDAESRESHTWPTPVAGILPQAAVVEDLKAVIRGEDENRVESAQGFTANQLLTSATASFKPATAMSWSQEGYPAAGQVKESRQVEIYGGITRTVTLWRTNVCGWIFDRDETVTLTAASVELTVRETDIQGKPHLTLYGIIAEEAPTNAAYSAVFHGTVLGEADANVGEATRINLNAAALALLNAGTIHGVGLRYDNQYVVLAQSAALLMNGEA